MLDHSTPRGRIIAAALSLAAERGWRGLSLGDIAAAAGVPLAELSHLFQSKAGILAGFSEDVDRALLDRFAAPGTELPRDRLFDVILTRFELLAPYKPALRRIASEGRADLGGIAGQMSRALKSQYWMLAAAGIDGEGPMGRLRVQGLLALYARVFAVWLHDDDPGMARTMATLDRRLRRAERAMQRVERLGAGLSNMFRAAARRDPHHGSGTGPAEAPPATHI